MRRLLLSTGSIGVAGLVLGGILTAVGQAQLLVSLRQVNVVPGVTINPLFIGYAAVIFAFLVAGVNGWMQSTGGQIIGLTLADSNTKPALPPHDAEFLLHLLMDPRNCEALIGDLEERYARMHRKFGAGRANFWYWTQVIFTIGSIVWNLLKDIPRIPLLISLLTAAATYFSGRWFGH